MAEVKRYTWMVLMAALCACGSAERETKLIAIVTPSHDNPFFRAEAEAADSRARALSLPPPNHSYAVMWLHHDVQV